MAGTVSCPRADGCLIYLEMKKDGCTWVGSARNRAVGLDYSAESLGFRLQWRNLGAWDA